MTTARCLRYCAVSTLVCLLIHSASPAHADPTGFEISGGATITFLGEPSRDLSGAFVFECPPPPEFGLDCLYQSGEVSLHVASVELLADGFALSGQGEFTAVATAEGSGFSISRRLTLEDVGVLSLPPPAKGAHLAYGFGAELIESSLEFDRYKTWILSTPAEGASTWSGLGPVPDSLVLEARLTEVFWEIGSLGQLTNSEGRSAELRIPLAQARIVSTETFLATGSTWRYLDDGQDAGTNWRTPGFDDSTWAAGPAELGYGDVDEATVVASGPSTGRFITTYFRQTFEVGDPSAVEALRLRLLRDDGAVVYLNGAEVHRTNMPSGVIASSTRASSAIGGSSEDSYEQTFILPSLLVQGQNHIAVEIHQISPSSSDISFDLELAADAAGLTRRPYLQLTTSNAVTVRWRTNVPLDTQFAYGSSSSDLLNVIYDPTASIEHEVRIEGLDAATRYYYSAGTSNVVLAGANSDHFFETAPAQGDTEPTRFWVIGDSGACSANAQGCIDAGKVRDSYLTRAAVLGKADLLLMLGDNAYASATDAETTKGVFDTFGEVLRNTPVWPAPGNHEFGNGVTSSATQSGPYFEAFSLPRAGEAGGVSSGTEAYYSFDFSNVHFISLDSHDTSRSVDGAMYAWLEADLQWNTADFTVAFWHHPPYSFGSHNSDSSAEVRMTQMRTNFVRLLEDYGVDLVLTGHSHDYERSKLIDGHYGKSNTLQAENIIDGGSGSPVFGMGYEKASLGAAAHEGAIYSVVGSSSKNSGGLSRHPIMAAILNFEGSMVVEVTDQQLDAVWFDMNGLVWDRFRITKGVDRDRDGVRNEQDAFPDDAREYMDTDMDGLGNIADRDDDGDSLVDAFEIQLGTDPLVADTDADGSSDSFEILWGSDPLEASSVPAPEPATNELGWAVLLAMAALLGKRRLSRERLGPERVSIS